MTSYDCHSKDVSLENDAIKLLKLGARLRKIGSVKVTVILVFVTRFTLSFLRAIQK